MPASGASARDALGAAIDSFTAAGVETPRLDAEVLLARMDPEDSDPVRRLLQHSPDTAGGLMTPEPVILAPDTTVAGALARVRDPDLTPALWPASRRRRPSAFIEGQNHDDRPAVEDLR